MIHTRQQVAELRGRLNALHAANDRKPLPESRLVDIRDVFAVVGTVFGHPTRPIGVNTSSDDINTRYVIEGLIALVLRLHDQVHDADAGNDVPPADYPEIHVARLTLDNLTPR